MNKENFTLLDEPYARALERVTETFSTHKIPYVVVGGCGIQASIADTLTGKGNASITQRKYELQWILRPTPDIDIATNSDRFHVGTALQELTLSDPSITITLPYSYAPVINLTSKDKTASVHLNIQTKPEEFKGLTPLYHEIVRGGRVANLKYNSNRSFETYVASPEHLIASKLTRAKEKDVVDIVNLIRTTGKTGISREEIAKILEICGKEEKIVTLDCILADLR